MKKDYYAILGVDRSAGLDEIRRAYRRLAFERHPDRNRGSRESEAAFRELTEAYAVLGDPARRSAYDASLQGQRPGAGPSFDPADLFADLFRNPAFGQMFSQMAREFSRQGLRFDEPYLRRVFSQGGGGVWFGGLVFVGPLSGLFSALFGAPHRGTTPPPDRPAELPRSPGRLSEFLRSALPWNRPSPTAESGERRDLVYRMAVPGDRLRNGGSVRISVPGPAGSETYDVRIPAGAKPGTRLRLPGRGAGSREERGDLYLEILPGG